jgi:hypothetical protein
MAAVIWLGASSPWMFLVLAATFSIRSRDLARESAIWSRSPADVLGPITLKSGVGACRGSGIAQTWEIFW